jgi:sterol desaturase/sphingolipid hydroxylase (fatty acid hydroxylase superfamily)
MSEPEPDVDHGASESSLPPLDTVDSRWWYWIAAYPVAMLVSIPIMVVAMLLFIVPAFVVGVEPQPGPGSWGFITLIGVVLGLLMMVVIVAAFALAYCSPSRCISTPEPFQKPTWTGIQTRSSTDCLASSNSSSPH